MTSTLTTPTDFYLLVIPAVFGFVFAFVFGLGVYQCATLSRVKGTYKKRNRVLESRLAHSLAYCDENNVTSVYDALRELGYADLCDLSKSGSRSASGSFSSGSSSKHKSSHKKSKSKSREASSGESGESAERSAHKSHSPSRQHDSSRNQQGRRSQRTRSSFVLEEVHMMDSDDEYSNDS